MEKSGKGGIGKLEKVGWGTRREIEETVENWCLATKMSDDVEFRAKAVTAIKQNSGDWYVQVDKKVTDRAWAKRCMIMPTEYGPTMVVEFGLDKIHQVSKQVKSCGIEHTVKSSQKTAGWTDYLIAIEVKSNDELLKALCTLLPYWI